MRAGSVSSSVRMDAPGAVGTPGSIEGASSERKQQLQLDVHWKHMQLTFCDCIMLKKKVYLIF